MAGEGAGEGATTGLGETLEGAWLGEGEVPGNKARRSSPPLLGAKEKGVLSTWGAGSVNCWAFIVSRCSLLVSVIGAQEARTKAGRDGHSKEGSSARDGDSLF